MDKTRIQIDVDTDEEADEIIDCLDKHLSGYEILVIPLDDD